MKNIKLVKSQIGYVLTFEDETGYETIIDITALELLMLLKIIRDNESNLREETNLL